MFGRFNRILIVVLFFLSSCILFEEEEEEIKDIYQEIPIEYAHVIKPIRALKDSTAISVVSKSGLIDQLFPRYANKEKKFLLSKRITVNENGRQQTIYSENFNQELIPDLYNFYTFSYALYLIVDYTSNDYDPLDYMLSIYLNQDVLFQMNLKDSSIITQRNYTDLGKASLDSDSYKHLYKFELPLSPFINEDIKIVYFDMEKGVVRFETFKNEVFNILY